MTNPLMAARLCSLAFLAAIIALPAVAEEAGTRVDITPPDAAAPDKSGYTLFDPTPTSALRAFDTDRPTKSNVPTTVDAGHFQYETDLFSYTHANAGGVSTRLYTAFDPVIKVGLTDHVDFEMQFTGVNWLASSPAGKGGSAVGAGDLILRTKVNLFGNEGGPALALIPYVKFPTAAKSMGNGHTDGGLIATFTYPLLWDFTLLLMPEVDVLENLAGGGHHFNYTQLINISHPIGPAVTVYGELYSALGTDRRLAPVYTFDTAVAYAITDSLQWDVGVNVGLNRCAPNLQVYSGLAERF